jgi:hypothetical protein
MKSFTQDVSSHVARVVNQVLYASPRKVELFLTFFEESFPMDRPASSYGAPRSYTSTRPTPVPLFRPESKAVY